MGWGANIPGYKLRFSSGGREMTQKIIIIYQLVNAFFLIIIIII